MIVDGDEVFLPIPHFPGYLVSNCGRVYSCYLQDLMAVKTSTTHGGLSVKLRRDNKRHYPTIGQLVLSAFVGPKPTPDSMAMLIDGIPHHCYLENLQWATSQEIHDNQFKNGTHAIQQSYAGSCPNQKLSADDAQVIRAAYAIRRESHKDIAVRWGVSKVAIRLLINGQTHQIPGQVTKDKLTAELVKVGPPLKCLDGEDWATLGFGEYLISTKGRLWNPKTQRFLGTKTLDGLLRVSINGKGYMVGRLVLTAFNRPPKGRSEKCHYRDENSLNVCIENLTWVSK